jgi:hypothetical protein
MTTTKRIATDTNPWLITGWLITVAVGLAGIILTSSNADPAAFDYDPAAAEMGRTLLAAGGVMLAVVLAGAGICWQLRRGQD